ncbi:hypothetical protein COHA_010517 [Chlorella ohadii]|uniref:U-box domain-containing protein n=1 Tax=Chlorella ohadii TaxID=2649997 RepID=A0AAD5GWX4_9CHLO|nr:hypothetical protein COHA_010517 [Chlorella ohadii]
MLCPITLEPFEDPVVAADGRIYERAAIEQWLYRDGRDTSPMTNEPLPHKLLLPCPTVRRCMEEVADFVDSGLLAPAGFQQLRNMLSHLRIAIPAVAAAVWAVQRLLHHRGPEGSGAPSEAPGAADQDEGEEVSLELPTPAKGSAQLPFPAPPPLKAVLLDVELPISLAALWLALFHNASSLLADFHQQLGDLDISISPWRQKDDVRRRVMRYTTPLKNPLGPRQARNTEVLEAVQLTGQGFTLRARCTSEGVPFASCFANHVQWVATPHGTHSSRLVVTGECRFHSPVWGPLKGQIERESIKS